MRKMKYAYLAGGCFWCITPTFNELDGVSEVVSGYSGGDEVSPSYEAVKHQETGHRESIKIVYDETKVSYEQLIDIFLMGVDPFDGGGQFIDRGASYTLAIFYTDDSEASIAREKITALEKESGRQVYISIEPFKSFYDAEEYHQNYYLKNPEAFEKELIDSGRKQAE